MAGLLQDVSRTPLLDKLPRVENTNPVADSRDDPDIVADEQHTDPRRASQLVHQLQDHRFRRDIQAGRRLIHDQQPGIAGERHRDHHPLLLAA